MQLSRTRLICRAHNRFNPSIALWQHFVQASPSTPRDRRQLSTATEAAQDGASSSSKNDVSQARDAQDTEVVTENAEAKQLPVRRMTTVKGRWLSSKVEVSVAKNKHLKRTKPDISNVESQNQLAIARDAFAKSQDYQGVVVRPIVGGKPIRESALPWCVNMEGESSMTGMDRYFPKRTSLVMHAKSRSSLHSEIVKFYNYTKPDRYETAARRHLIEQVQRQVKQVLPQYNVEVFGSERTGIAMPLSDIDFRLVLKSQPLDPAKVPKLPPDTKERKKGTHLLHQLYWKLFSKNGAYLLAAVRHARYPLVAAQDRKSGLDVQVVLSNDTSISMVTMQEYMEKIPYLRELYWVVKTLFDTRGLSDVFRGGFGSYSLFMMVVASIKHAPKPPKDSARALLHFLDFWGNFDTTKHGVSIEPAYLFDKVKHPVLTDARRAQLQSGETQPLPSYMLSLRDPADETNDLGRKGIAIKHVQATFRDLHKNLLLDMKYNKRASILCPLVGTSYMLQLERRRKLQNYGREWVEREQKDLAKLAKQVREGTEGQLVLEKESEVEDWDKETREAMLSGQTLEDIEKEEARLRLAKEERDREWRRLAEEKTQRLKEEAQNTSILDHGDTMSSILGVGMPAVEDPQTSKDSVDGQGDEAKKA
ncbi:hypothetical protein J4E93_006405 [Alternaria ventricosa]|uniref:uncharacterized protein n=1 Tax=Alternaria ventricosa TaxID=1187951 RepID=UPI0020C5749C|nr:uncharacterized protein J4E93_006405 [Alternaria ventricosa]KAI4644500.1 hypothetical protein J4E93_006405 [Alternaria ventricosa]